MIVFIVRRLLAGVLVLLGASFIVFVLMSMAGDPLAFLLTIPNITQREATRVRVTEVLHLDVPLIPRYFMWLGDVLRGDFGQFAQSGLSVNEALKLRIPMTLKLVGAATLLSIVIGVSTGIVTAIRQYSGFDYLTTFFTFVFFSLPVFWVAVILKNFGGINFNDWLRDSAQFSPAFLTVSGIFTAMIIYSSAGGRPRRKAVVTLIGTAFVLGIMIYVSATQWMRNPSLGPVVIALLSIAIALGVTAITAGLRNVKVRNTALTTAALGTVLYFPLQIWLDDMSFPKLFGLGLIALASGVAIGYAWGGFDKGTSARTGALVALLIGLITFVDRVMQSWAEYSSKVRGRPIKTIGDKEARLQGDFWVHMNDTFSHLILPTMALMLISLATYTRYSRSSMLEVLNQDYIRTARSKGLTERTVVIRHGLRNALIPLATVVALDVGALLGGAVITETVFEWDAMGRLFIDGLRGLDPSPVMAFFVVIGVMAIMFNLIADLLYAVLDPRIRIS